MGSRMETSNRRKSSLVSTPVSLESPTRFTFLPSSQRYQDSYSSGVFHILSSYLNFCYFIFLIPFRFTSEGEGNEKIYKLHQNTFQMIFSSLALFCTIFYSLANIRYCFRENIHEKPTKVFKNANVILNVAYQLTWSYTFWVKRDEFGNLLRICHNDQRATKPPVYIRVVLFSIILFNAVKLCWEWGYDFLSEGIEQGIRYRAQSGLYMFYLTDNDTMSPDEIISEKLAIFSWCHLIIEIYFYHHLYLIELFPLLAAIMIYFTTNDFVNQLKCLDASQDQDANHLPDISEEIMKLYCGYKEIVECINKFSSPITIVFFVMMTPTWVWSVFGIFEIENWTFAIYYAHKLALYTAQLVIAAEAYSKAIFFQNWLFSRRRQQVVISSGYQEFIFEQESRVLHYIYADEPMRFAGLKGGDFFTITYSFIGTMSSVVITYAVVMLQFKLT